MLIDTHTHLYLPEFNIDGGGAAAVRRAIQAGVDVMVFPNVDLTTIAPMEALCADFPGRIYMGAGLHPTEVKESWKEDASKALRAHDPAKPYVAIGEIGIDLYWDKTFEREQMMCLDMQMGYAVRHSLPAIIHCRDGLDQVLEVLSGHKSAGVVFHSFGGSIADVERIRRIGDYYFGINGVVTFKNCTVRDTLPAIGIERILLESDSPYLAPVPKRGKRNESAFLPYTAQHVAESMGIDMDTVAIKTSENARRFFNLPDPASRFQTES